MNNFKFHGIHSNFRDRNAKCFNTVGSYNCKCNYGYESKSTNSTEDSFANGVVTTGDTVMVCVDIDECKYLGEMHPNDAGVIGDCGDGAICRNTDGSYTCQCGQGYQGQSPVKCCSLMWFKSSIVTPYIIRLQVTQWFNALILTNVQKDVALVSVPIVKISMVDINAFVRLDMKVIPLWLALILMNAHLMILVMIRWRYVLTQLVPIFAIAKAGIRPK